MLFEMLAEGVMKRLFAPRSRFSEYVYARPGETVSGPNAFAKKRVLMKFTQFKSSIEGDVMKRRSFEFQSKSLMSNRLRSAFVHVCSMLGFARFSIENENVFKDSNFKKFAFDAITSSPYTSHETLVVVPVAEFVAAYLEIPHFEGPAISCTTATVS